MDDSVPTIEMGFAIDAGNSIFTLQQVQQAVVGTEGAIVAAATEIERATSGMLNVGGGIATIKALGNEGTKAERDIAREKRQNASLVEREIRNLDRLIPTIGKNKTELRALRIEEMAANAMRLGNADLAEALRARERAAYEAEFAIMRRAKAQADELAEAKVIAAVQAEQAATREANALRDAAAAHQMFEARVRQGVVAMREAEAAAARDAAALERFRAILDPAAAAQSRLNKEVTEARRIMAAAGLGADEIAKVEEALGSTAGAAAREANALRDAAAAHQMFEARVRQGVSAMREEEAAVARDAAALERFRAILDPAAAAQDRLNKELAEARRVMTAAGLGADDIAKVEGALGKTGGAAVLAKHDLMNLYFQLNDVWVSLMSGQRPLTVLIQQGSQISQIAMQSGVGFGGMVRSVAALIPPVTAAGVVLAGTAAIAIGATAAWYSYANAVDRLTALSQGSGRLIGATGEGLEQVAESAASAAGITVAAAREIEIAYVQAGRIGMTVLPGLIAVTNNFAAATGQSAEQATQALGAAFSDVAKGADDLTAKYGILDARTLAYVHTLVEQGEETKAQRVLLDALQGSFDGAADHANILAKAWRGISSAASDAWSWMGKAIDRALGGGSLAEQIADLQKQRGGMIARGFDTTSVDRDIAEKYAALQREKTRSDNAAARKARDAVDAGLKVVDSFTGGDKLGELRTNLTAVNRLLADGGKAAGLSAEQIADARTAQDAYNRAVTTFIPPAEKRQKLAAIDAQIAAARDPAQKALLSSQKLEIQQAGEVITKAEAAAEVRAKGNQTLATASRASANHAAQLAREAEAVRAQVDNLYALANAYRLTGGEALIAEARTKAESQAIKQRGDIEAAVNRQIQLVIAQRVADGERGAASLRAQADAQEKATAMVVAGLAPAERMAELVRAQMDDLPLLQAIDAAQKRNMVKEATAAAAALDTLRAARERDAAAAAAAQFVLTMSGARDEIEMLQLQIRLIGASTRERVVAIATLKAWQEASRMRDGIDNQLAYVDAQVKIAVATQEVADRTREADDALFAMSDRWDLIARNAQNAARGMADAFGQVGQALGDVAAIYADYSAEQARGDAEHLKRLKEATSAAAKERENARYALQTSTMQIGLYGDMTAAAKGFFKQGSDGYQALATAEKAFRAVEFALSVKAMAQDAINTASSVANSGARTAADAVSAVVKAMASLPFPLNLAAGAATVAALTSLGVSIAGSFGGSKNRLDKANDGTGTTFGDGAAKSQSLQRAIEAVKEVDTITSVYAREMAGSLRSIDNQIANLATVVVRAGDINASAGIDTGFKSNLAGKALGNPLGGAALGTGLAAGAISSFGTFTALGAAGGPIGLAAGAVLGTVLAPVLKGLFGTKTKVIGSGLFGDAQSISDILNGGLDLQSYSDVEKKKKMFGLTSSKKYSTVYGDLGDDTLGQQFTLILRSFNDAIVKAAGPLGVATDDISSRISGFVFSLGKIDLQGLSGTEIQEKLTAVFGAAADQMARAGFPEIERFQKVGEGAFETLVRVASTVEAVTMQLDLLGAASRGLGVDAKMFIADQFESVSAMTSAFDGYFSSFYSKSEQAAARTAQFARVFDSLGLAMPSSIAAFRQLVEAQDLTTDAGRAAYATLLQLSPAFADLQTSLLGAKSAADVLAEREDLNRQLLEAQGNTAALRAMDLAKLDESNRALQQQIWAIEDAKAAADAAEDLRKAWMSVGDSIIEEVERIRGLTGADSGAGFAQIMGQFNAATDAARLGDMDAAKNLPGLSQALIDAAKLSATSRQELERVQAQTAASLEQTYGIVSKFSSDPEAMTPAEAAMAVATGQISDSKAASNDNAAAELRAMREEMAQMRSDLTKALAAIAGNTGTLKDDFKRVTEVGGGDAIATRAVA